MSRADGPWLPFEGVGDSALELHFIVESWRRCFCSVMFYHLESKILRGALDFIGFAARTSDEEVIVLLSL